MELSPNTVFIGLMLLMAFSAIATGIFIASYLIQSWLNPKNEYSEIRNRRNIKTLGILLLWSVGCFLVSGASCSAFFMGGGKF
jgi:hypothetical protein